MILERRELGLGALHAQLEREGLRASEFLVVRDAASLAGAVEACRVAQASRTPIIVLTADAARDEEPIVIGEVGLDPAKCLVRVRGREWLVRAKPVAVLRALMRRPGEVVKRETLIREVWGTDRAGANRALRVYIHDLRKILERDRHRPHHIVTVRGDGCGYVFRG